jgi:hypothetical protein
MVQDETNPNNVPGLNWRDGTPEIFLNEIPSDAERTMGIPMSEIAYIKVFRPPFMSATGSGASGAIAIYTKKPSDANNLIKGIEQCIDHGLYSRIKNFIALIIPCLNPNYRIHAQRFTGTLM